MSDPSQVNLLRPKQKIIHGLDPGSNESALITINTDPFKIVDTTILPNDDLLFLLKESMCPDNDQVMAIEFMQSYGMSVGRTVFETAMWVGRFIEGWGGDFALHIRSRIKAGIVGVARAKDPDVTRALKVRFGEVGSMKNPGPLYGVKTHLWSALAVAVYHMDGAKLGEW